MRLLLATVLALSGCDRLLPYLSPAHLDLPKRDLPAPELADRSRAEGAGDGAGETRRDQLADRPFDRPKLEQLKLPDRPTLDQPKLPDQPKLDKPKPPDLAGPQVMLDWASADQLAWGSPATWLHYTAGKCTPTASDCVLLVQLAVYQGSAVTRVECSGQPLSQAKRVPGGAVAVELWTLKNPLVSPNCQILVEGFGATALIGGSSTWHDVNLSMLSSVGGNFSPTTSNINDTPVGSTPGSVLLGVAAVDDGQPPVPISGMTSLWSKAAPATFTFAAASGYVNATGTTAAIGWKTASGANRNWARAWIWLRP